MNTRLYQIDKANRLGEIPVPESGLGSLPGDELHWLDINAADQDAAEEFLRPFSLDERVLAECFLVDEGPRVGTYGDKLVIRFPVRMDVGSTNPDSVALICSPTMLITISSTSQAYFEPLIHDLANSHPIPRRSIPALVFKLLEFATEDVVPKLLNARNRIVNLTDQIDDDADAVDVGEILHLKQAVGRIAIVWEDQLYCATTLLSWESDIFNVSETRDYYRDLVGGLTSGHRLILRLEQRLQDLNQHYQLHLDSITSKRLRILTVLSAVYLPSTLIAAIYGMNFTNIPIVGMDYGYFIILAFMVFLVAGQLGYFYFRGWFS